MIQIFDKEIAGYQFEPVSDAIIKYNNDGTVSISYEVLFADLENNTYKRGRIEFPRCDPGDYTPLNDYTSEYRVLYNVYFPEEVENEL